MKVLLEQLSKVHHWLTASCGVRFCRIGLHGLDKTLHKELNECFLLHGTTSSSVEAIARVGLDMRLSRDTALYGRGIYLAESLDKAFMYTG